MLMAVVQSSGEQNMRYHSHPLVLLSNYTEQGCNGQSQSPIDIPAPPDSPSPEVTPLVMTNYDKVRQF